MLSVLTSHTIARRNSTSTLNAAENIGSTIGNANRFPV